MTSLLYPVAIGLPLAIVTIVVLVRVRRWHYPTVEFSYDGPTGQSPSPESTSAGDDEESEGTDTADEGTDDGDGQEDETAGEDDDDPTDEPAVPEQTQGPSGIRGWLVRQIYPFYKRA